MTLHVVVAGASGFLGTHLTQRLRDRGHRVTRLVRRPVRAGDEASWDPYAGTLDAGLVASADVVVNLAGSPTAGTPHSARWARELRASRITTTRTLAHAVAAAEHPPAFLAGNAVAYYGDHAAEGDAVVTEQSASLGNSMMTVLTRDWQAAAEPAAAAGARLVILRTAPVMDRHAPPLKQMRLAWKAGLGARLGDGSQYFPIVSLRDWLAAVTFLAEHESAAGPFNVCAPRTPTNRELTRALARAVRRPALLAVPAPVLRIAGGRLAPELLGSMNLRPAALEELGHEFRDRDDTAVLAAGLASRTA
jgi:uncharacterized protein (TIGR01777 family)